MIIYHKNNIGAFTGGHKWYFRNVIVQTIAGGAGRIMASLVLSGGLVSYGGCAGEGGGLAG